MKRIPATLAALAAAVVAFGAAAQEEAKQAPAEVPGLAPRVLGEWTYVPVTAMPGPYVTGSAGSTTGLGRYTLNLDLQLPPAISPRTTDLTYLALLQRFEAQVALLRGFAVRASVQGEGLIPDTSTSALSLTLDGTWAAGAGIVARLVATEKMMFSLTADFLHAQQTLVSPAGLLAQTAQSRRLGDLFTRQDADRVLAGGSFALAFTNWLGLVAEATWDGRWQSATGVLRKQAPRLGFINLAAALGANLRSRNVPIAGTAFWRESIPVRKGNPFGYSRQYGAGLFYSGSPCVDVGIEVFGESSAQRPGNVVRQASRIYLAPGLRGYF